MDYKIAQAGIEGDRSQHSLSNWTRAICFFDEIHPALGRTAIIGVNLTLAWRLKPQLHKRNPPTRVTKLLIFG
ncbi:MAG TPA: hypothetical protein V6C85_15230 [Allocoleopsis sp.]